MIDNPSRTLKQAIDEFLQWMISTGYSFRTCDTYRNELNSFFLFIIRKQIDWNDIFSLNTLEGFQKNTKAATGPGVRGLWQYLFDQQRIHQPIDPPHRRLPDPYEDYLLYYNQTREVSSIYCVILFEKLGQTQKDLIAFDGTIFQVLSLPEPLNTYSRQKLRSTRGKGPVPIAQVLQQSLRGLTHDR